MKVTISSESTSDQAVSKMCPNLSVSKRWKYFRRILKYRQMDFEFALWQMLYLFISPSKVLTLSDIVLGVRDISAVLTSQIYANICRALQLLIWTYMAFYEKIAYVLFNICGRYDGVGSSRYRNFEYHKHTKHQWARDDPAFLVLLSIWLSVSCIGFSLVLHLSFFAFIRFTLWVVLMEFVGVGLLIATLLWFISNKYLRTRNAEGTKQLVEWGYAFDVHLNAFFPLLVILHVIQLFFVKFLDHQHGFTILLCNTLWLIAFIYYGYITFLGYSALPFLRKTVVLLYPVPLLLILYIVAFVYSCNIGHEVLDFYKNVIR